MFLQERIRVGPDGSKDAKIALVGEAPGVVEERVGKPFKGPAGGVLDECLHGAGIIRADCYITNLFKSKVEKTMAAGVTKIFENKVLLWSSKKGFTTEGLVYRDELHKELQSVSSNVVVALGGPAIDAMTGKKGVWKWRGSILRAIHTGRKVVCAIHPSQILQSGSFLSRYYLIFDLNRAKEESERPDIVYPRQSFLLYPTLEQIERYLDSLAAGGFANYDVEIVNEEIYCISFAADLHYAMVIPFVNKQGVSYWSLEDEMRIWLLIQRLLSNPKVVKCNQNLLFDDWILATRNRIVRIGPTEDPMVANHLMYPDFPKGLDFLTSIHTKIPYYKDEGKIHMKGVSNQEEFLRYNAQDSCVSAECLRIEQMEMREKGYIDTYLQTMDLYDPLLAMMVRGFKVDQEALKQTKVEVERKIVERQAELDSIAGRPLNVGSFKQLTEYFYTEKRIKPYTKKGKATVDDKALARLAKPTSQREGFKEAKLIQEIRSLRKMLSTYLDMTIDPDGRMRCSLNPRGATTGRLSSSKTIFGTGMNQQNLPLEFRRFLVADYGYLLSEIDKRQAEWVVVAYYSGDANMIEVVEKGLDPHARTGQLITGVDDLDLILTESAVLKHETDPIELEARRKELFPDLIKDRNKGLIYLPRTMTIRQCGKKSNHGLNYGMGYSKFALENELEERESKLIVERYHQGYPGIRGSYWNRISTQLAENRTLTNCFGRKRQFMDRWGDELLKAGYDFIPQSTVADLINKGLIAAYRDMGRLANVELLTQTHDSVTYQFPINYHLDYLYAAKAIETWFSYLNPELDYFGRKFHIASDLKVGLNWRDMEEVDANGTTLEELARRLSSLHREHRANAGLPPLEWHRDNS